MELMRPGRPTQSPELQEDVGSFRMDGIDDLATYALTAHSRNQQRNHATTNLLPRGNLRVVPNSWGVSLARRLGGDVGGLGDEERAGDGGALRVVLDAEVGRDVRVVVAQAGEGCEDDAVRELHVANLDRREESRSCIGGRRHLSDGLLVRGYEVREERRWR